MNNNNPVGVLSVNIAAPGRTLWINNLGPSDAQDIARALSDSAVFANRAVDVWKAGELVLTFVNGISRHDDEMDSFSRNDGEYMDAYAVGLTD